MKSLRASLRKQGRKLTRISLRPGQTEWRTTEQKTGRDKTETKLGSRIDNVCLSISSAMPYFNHRRKPVAIVQNYNGNFHEFIQQNGLKDAHERFKRIYEDNVAAEKSDTSFIKDTTTSTVQENTQNFNLNRPPPDLNFNPPPNDFSHGPENRVLN